MQIAKKHAEEIYLVTHNELKERVLSYDAFVTLWCIIEQYTTKSSSWDKIISCVDPDSRVAHKSRNVRKAGYKNHIIVDEDSEIILASEQTPFNVGDEKKLTDLVEKVQSNFGITPDEVSADKVYGTINNRAYLKDSNIITNIAFPDTSEIEYTKFDISMFHVSEDMQSAECPNRLLTKDYRICKNKKEVRFKFPKEACSQCPLRTQCLSPNDLEKNRGRSIEISIRYDAVTRDINRNITKEFEVAINKRYIVERRFATLVRNHGLRRSRYLRIKGAKVHITMANIACNIVRMVSLLLDSRQPSIAMR